MQPEANRYSRLQALLCVAILTICVLLTRPFVEMGVNDDWSFIRTAEILAQSGHIAYNGWAAMILGWQVIVGALFIKLFGFSFTVVRLPTILVALLTPYLLHRILVRFGLNAWNAILLTLTIVLSPIFLPLAVTFMTDVSGFFCILLCLYSCQRALQATSSSAFLRWLYCAALVNILAGTVRQIVWLGILVMVPCTAWLLRRRKNLLLHGSALWLFGVLCIFACVRWYTHQPYSANEKLIDGTLNAEALSNLGWSIVKAFVSSLFFALPILVVFPIRLLEFGYTRAVKIFSVIGVILVLILIPIYWQFRIVPSLDKFAVPWMLNVFTTRGLMQLGVIVGAQPILIHLPLRIGLSLLTLVSGMSCITYLLFADNKAFADFKEPRHIPALAKTSALLARVLTWHQTLFLLVPFSLAYLALLMPRAAFHTLFDRYLIPLLLVLGVLVLRRLQEKSSHTAWGLSAAILLVFSLYTVAGTHDMFALDRARLTAADEVTNAGIPRTSLDGGLEYDGWTQLLAAGYVNDPHILIPAGAYHPQPKDLNLCHFSFMPYTPTIKPEYVLSFDPSSCFKPSHFPSVPYHTWIAPRHRTVYVQQVN